jgi:cation diffusion facilitator family transporter
MGHHNHIQKEKEKWATYSLLINLGLTVLKFIFSLMTGSLSLLAEAIHSFSDLIASSISLISVKLANKKYKEFPYGLYKIENIASIIISFFLFFAAYEIIKTALFSEEHREIKNIEYAIAVMVLTMIVTFVFSRMELKAAKKLDSPVLEADAKHIWADFLSSLVVLIGLIGTALGYNIDKYAAVIVSIFIFHSGWEIFTSGLKVLLDVSLEKEEIEKIKEIIKEFPAVNKIKSIRGRQAGSFKFLDIELVINNYSLREAHRIVDEIADRIKKEIPNIDSVFIHYEPVRQEGLRIGFLTDETGKYLRDFKTARKLVIIDIDGNNKESNKKVIEVNPNEREIGEIAYKNNLDVLVSKNHPDDFDVRWKLAKAGVVVWETDEENIDKILKEIINSWEKNKD